MRRNPFANLGQVRLPRLPNTRTGALMAVGALILVGFLVALVLLFVVPRLFRPQARPIDPRARAVLVPQPVRTPQGLRPELWVTPTAFVVFPAADAPSELRGAPTVTYDPQQPSRELALPPLRDAQGRAVVAGLVSLGADDDPSLAGPHRPDQGEPTRLTVALSAVGSEQLAGCVLSIASGTLRATGAIGSARPDECQNGLLRLPTGGAAAFAISGDVLPNYRSRDGAWRPGGVFGRTEVRVALTAPPGA